MSTHSSDSERSESRSRSDSDSTRDSSRQASDGQDRDHGTEASDARARRPDDRRTAGGETAAGESGGDQNPAARLQQAQGNRAVSRAVAAARQRRGEQRHERGQTAGGSDTFDTADHTTGERGGGQQSEVPAEQGARPAESAVAATEQTAVETGTTAETEPTAEATPETTAQAAPETVTEAQQIDEEIVEGGEANTPIEPREGITEPVSAESRAIEPDTTPAGTPTETGTGARAGSVTEAEPSADVGAPAGAEPSTLESSLESAATPALDSTTATPEDVESGPLSTGYPTMGSASSSTTPPERGDTTGSNTAGSGATGSGGSAGAPSVPGTSGDSPALPSADQLLKLGIQPKLTVGGPNDAYERQADAVASAATRSGPGSDNSTLSGEESVRVSATPTADLEPVQTSASADAATHPPLFDSVEKTIRNPGAGSPVPERVRSRVEPVLGTSLDGVSVHDGPKAARAAGNIGARAFTRGSNIFLGNGESAHDTKLMAHEATHAVQQTGTDDDQTSQSSSTADIQPFLPDSVLRRINSIADNIPGWNLFTVIIGYNPLLGETVDRTPENLVEALLKLVPFGKTIVEKLREMEIFQKAFTWVKDKLDKANLTLARLKQTIEDAWEEASLIRGIQYNINVAKRHFGDLYRDVVSFAGSLVTGIMDLVRDAVVGLLEKALGENKAYELLTKILGKDPLRDEQVEAEPSEILADFLLLIGKEQHLQKLREENKLEDAANWIATQFSRFTDLLGELGSLFTQVLEFLSPANLLNLADNLRALVANVGTFLGRVYAFASDVASKVLEVVKDALLNVLKQYATSELPGFDLLTVILGRNPFTGEKVPRTAVTIMRGFITLLPGGAAVYRKLSEAGVIEQAGARIQEAMTQLGISWEFVVGLFKGIWDSITIEALLEPIATFQRIIAQFREPVSRLFAFLQVVLRETFHVLLAMMNFPTDLIGSIITNAMAAFQAIRQDPVGFLLNMLGAVKLGFQTFFADILTYLGGGLVDWMFRGLRGAGIEPPTDFSFQSVLDFVLEVLGITTDMLWEKLGQHIGEENVERIRGAIDRLTGIWTFVKDVQERGVIAIWEYIQGQISGLWDMVLQKAQDWILERVINRAIRWLLSLLDPTGIMAVINGFQAFISAVQSAAEYAADMLGILGNYVSAIAAVARGELAAGAEKIVTGLANAIPVAIGFLANQFGLGNIGEKITEIVGSIRGVVERAVDWLIDRAVGAMQSVLQALGAGRTDQEAEDETEREPVDPSDHSAVARRAVAELEALPPNVNTYEELRAAKEQQARKIEELYTTVLGPGIGLFVQFESAQRGDEDGALDFTVSVAPNTEQVSGSVQITQLAEGITFQGNVLTVHAETFTIGDQIYVSRIGVHTITNFNLVTMQTLSRLQITVQEVAGTNERMVRAHEFDDTWRVSDPEAQLISVEELAQANQNDVWSSRRIARIVLNYRHWQKQTNPPGKEWEHIHEHSTGGANSVENLALVDRSKNQELGRIYGREKSVRWLEQEFPTVGAKLIFQEDLAPGQFITLRAFVGSMNAAKQREYKLAFYEDMGLTLRPADKGEGSYQVLE